MDKKGTKRGRHPGEKAKKRSFRGNQHTAEENTDFVSTSAQKLQGEDDCEVNFDPIHSYSLLSFYLVFTSLQAMVKCKLCNGDIEFLKRSQQGLGFKLCVKCPCKETLINSCPMIKNAYEINRRLVFVMRLLGIGKSGLELFCSLMDLGRGLSNQAYYSIVEHIHIAVNAVAKNIFQKAVKEEQEKNIQFDHSKNEITVSGDGSWSKRGFTSLLGIVSLIGKYSNKILDVIVKSSVCKACEKWSGKEKSDEYAAWYDEHQENCTANHEGSAGKMEVDGIIEMFKRSEECLGVKYTKYIGDGDTKTFKNLLEEDPYNGDPVIEKLECVLHVKKRMYRRVKEAKKLLNQYAKAKKQLEAAGNEKAGKQSAPKKKKEIKPKTMLLTNKIMLKLSTYYGLAIMRNINSLEEMKKAVWATFYHITSTDENPQHHYCPEGETSWCQYQQLKADNKEDTFIHPPTFDEEVIKVLKPIYEDLSDDSILKRCLGGNTQNNNESFNNCVWNLAPKHIFTGKKILEIATLTAACIFNEGQKSVLKIMDVMGVRAGAEAMNFVQRADDTRIYNAEKRVSDVAKSERIARRSARVAENDAYEETEGILYAPGIDD